MSTYYSTINFNANAAKGDKVPLGIVSVEDEQGYLILSGHNFSEIKAKYSARQSQFLEMALQSYFGSFLSDAQRSLFNTPIKVMLSLKDIARFSVYENGVIEFSNPRKVTTQETPIKTAQQLFAREIQPQ
jgi:hypothetical protein